MPGWPPGDDSGRRATQAEARSPRCAFNSEAACRRKFSVNLDTFAGTARCTSSATAPSSVGADANASAKCVAGHCPGKRIETRNFAVEPRWPMRCGVTAVGTSQRVSTKRVAVVVRKVRGGGRETEPGSRGTGSQAARSRAIDDSSRSRAGHGIGHGCVSWRPGAIC